MTKLVSFGHDDFYPLEFANQAAIIHSFDTKDNLWGLTPDSKQVAYFCADKNTTDWKVVKAQHRETGTGPSKGAEVFGPLSLNADHVVFLEEIIV